MSQRSEETPSSLYTTSFNPSKLSELSLNIIAFIYENGGATTTEISNMFQKPRDYIKRYVYNLRNYGLISKILHTWTLTSEGMKVLELFYKEKQVKKYYKKQRVKDVERALPTFTSFHTINNIIISKEEINNKTNQILHILENKLSKPLSSSEKEVVKKLFAHSLETGGEKSLKFSAQRINNGKSLLGSNSNYLPSVVVAERFFNFNDFREFQSVFTSLANKGIAYLYIDKKLEYTKVGIKKYLYDTLAVYYPELGLVMRTHPKKVMRIDHSN
jgi:DNA-binding MarR family transcriptional regulator